MKRSSFGLLALTWIVVAGCESLAGLNEDDTPNADGTYRGDFQVQFSYTEQTSTGSVVSREKTITGAVGFTIQGKKVITTPSAGDGTVTWDDFNKTMWVEFHSIASSNETFCARWRYHGGLLQSDQFLKGEGAINCVAPLEGYGGFAPFPRTYWKVTRQ